MGKDTEFATTGEEVTVTKNGKPVVLMRPIEEEFELKNSMKGDNKHGKGKAKSET